MNQMTNKRVGRPTNCRSVQDLPKITCFRPDGVPCRGLKSVVLTVDELEAIRLADKEGLYQLDASARMSVSRQTFGRILESAHKKVAEAILDGKKLCIQGGVIKQICDILPDERPDICVCPECGCEVPHLKGEPCRDNTCSQCGISLKRKGGCLSEA